MRSLWGAWTVASDRADKRRLDPVAALHAGVAGIGVAWSGAWAVLVLLSLLIMAPVVVPVSPVFGIGLAVVVALAGLTAAGALFRIAIDGTVGQARRNGLGAGGLQFGLVEMRILWGGVLNLLFLSMVLVVLSLVTLAVFGIAELDVAAIQARNWSAVGPMWKLAVLGLVSLAAVMIPVLILTRLSLWAPASVGRGKTVSLNSMGIAHGAFWPLILLWLVIGALAVAIAAVGTAGPLAGRVAAALLVPWILAPFAAGILGSAYHQLEYWTPDQVDPGIRTLRRIA